MYLRKGRRSVDSGDVLVNIESRESGVENGGAEFSPLPAGGARRAANWNTQNTKSSENKENNFHVDELPDGACIAPTRLVQKDTECTAVRDASYIGSFSVIGADQATRADYVKQQLVDMRTVIRSKPILLVISLSGIKICSSNGESDDPVKVQSVYMAHALRRVSYATCDPEFCQFSFLAREPKAQLNSQYCHAFVTSTPEQAEELNALVGNAFKMAYAEQRQKQPSFNQLIEAQIQEAKARSEVETEQTKKDLNKRLSLISTSTANDLAQQRKEFRRQQSEELALERERQRIAGKDRIWAKQAATKTKHRPGLTDSPTHIPYSQSTHNNTQSPSSNQTPHSNSQPNLKQEFEASFLVRQFGSPVVSLKETLDSQDPMSDLMQRFTQQYRPDSPLRSESPVTNGTAGIRNSSGRNSPHSPLLEKQRISPKRGSPKLKRRRKREENGGSPLAVESPLAAENGTMELDGDSYLLPITRKTPDDSPASTGSPRPTRRPSSDLARRPLPAVPLDSSPSDPLDQSEPRRRVTSPDLDQLERRRGTPDEGDQSDDSIRKAARMRRMSSDSDGRSFSPSCNNRSHSASPCLDPCADHSRDNSLSRRVETDFTGSVDMLGPPPPLPLSSENFAASYMDGQGMWRLRARNGYTVHRQYYLKHGIFLHQCCGFDGLDSLRRFDSPPPGGQLDDAALQQASWYQAGIPREIALEILSQEDIGSFIVRDSTTHQNCYALSVRVPKFENPTGISHYLIKQTPKGGYMLKGLDKEWPSLTSLVTHHTVMQEKLPCTLRLPRNTQNPTYHDVDPDHQDQADPDDDYQRLSDFTSMMADLNMEK